MLFVDLICCLIQCMFRNSFFVSFIFDIFVVSLGYLVLYYKHVCLLELGFCLVLCFLSLSFWVGHHVPCMHTLARSHVRRLVYVYA